MQNQNPEPKASPENKDQLPEKANPDDKGAKEVVGPEVSESGYKDIVLDEKGNEKVNMNSLDEDNDEATDKKESPSEEDKADTKEGAKKADEKAKKPFYTNEKDTLNLQFYQNKIKS